MGQTFGLNREKKNIQDHSSYSTSLPVLKVSKHWALYTMRPKYCSTSPANLRHCLHKSERFSSWTTQDKHLFSNLHKMSKRTKPSFPHLEPPCKYFIILWMIYENMRNTCQNLINGTFCISYLWSVDAVDSYERRIIWF